MTTRQEGQQSVRDILVTMHPTAQTLKDIGITKESKAFLTQANVKAWSAWAELKKEFASGSHWSDWQTERNSAKFNRDLTSEGDSGAELSADAEEMFQVMQSLEKEQEQEQAKAAEEVDLDFIDQFEPDPAHYAQAHANKKLSTQWTIEEGIEMQGLFDRGCLRKIKRADLPKGSRIVDSRFQYKI